MKLTRSRILYFALFVAALVYFVANLGYESFAAFVIALVLPLVSHIILRITLAFCPFKISVSGGAFEIADDEKPKIKYKPDAADIKKSILNFVIKGTAGRAYPVFDIFYTVKNRFTGESCSDFVRVSLPFTGELKFTVSLKTVCCGELAVNVHKVVCYDFLMLTSCKKKAEASCFVTVMPDFYAVYDGILFFTDTKEKRNKKYSINKSLSRTDSVSYREYERGDELRNVAPKMSAKMGDLYVREYYNAISDLPLVSLDLSENDDPLVYHVLISTMYSVALTYIKDNGCYIATGASNGKAPITPVTNTAELDKLVCGLFTSERLDTEDVIFPKDKCSFQIIITNGSGVRKSLKENSDPESTLVMSTNKFMQAENLLYIDVNNPKNSLLDCGAGKESCK